MEEMPSKSIPTFDEAKEGQFFLLPPDTMWIHLQPKRVLRLRARVARWFTYFHTKNPIFGYTLEGLGFKKYWDVLWPFGNICGHFVDFSVIWRIFYPMLLREKIWQPCFELVGSYASYLIKLRPAR
jgi:hypothetical protein